MAIDAVRTMWGYAVTCTGGTAVATTITEDKVAIQGILMTGAATTDIVTVTDGFDRLLYRGVAQNTSGSNYVFFTVPIRVEGIKVGVAGATTGWCSIFLA